MEWQSLNDLYLAMATATLLQKIYYSFFSFVYGFEWDEIGDFILSLQNPSLDGLYQKGYIDFLDFEVPEYQTHDLSIR